MLCCHRERGPFGRLFASPDRTSCMWSAFLCASFRHNVYAWLRSHNDTYDISNNNNNRTVCVVESRNHTECVFYWNKLPINFFFRVCSSVCCRTDWRKIFKLYAFCPIDIHCILRGNQVLAERLIVCGLAYSILCCICHKPRTNQLNAIRVDELLCWQITSNRKYEDIAECQERGGKTHTYVLLVCDWSITTR